MIAMSSYSQINYGREYIYPMMTLLYGLSYMPNTDSYIPVTEIKSQAPIVLFLLDYLHPTNIAVFPQFFIHVQQRLAN